MKDYKEESKRIKSELKKISDRANQICRILDKDDIDVDYINKIGQKKYIKTPNKHQHILPNLIYYQGKSTSKENSKSKKIKSKMKKNNLILNDFHSNFFKILKGADNEKVIKTFFYSKNLEKNHENNRVNKNNIETKLKIIAPELLKRKELIMERMPLYYKKYRKNYEYVNNQIILDEINEKRYERYDEPFKYSLNIFPSKDILPKYNNLFFKYEKNKIRDYFYKKPKDKFGLTEKNNSQKKFQICTFEVL